MKLVHEIWARRFALRNLALRNFRIRYRNMALGVLWSVLNPLVMLGVLVFVFTFVYPHAESGHAPFPVYILIGLAFYNIMARMLVAATNSVVEHVLLIKKIAFPRIMVPLASVLSQLVDTAIMLMLLLLFVALFRVPQGLALLWLPAILLVEIVFIIGCAFLFSAMNVFYRDMLYLVESGLTIMFWLTPVFYPLEFIRDHLPRAVYVLYLCNPVTGCIDSARRAIMLRESPDPLVFGVAAAVAVAVFIAGVAGFQKMQRYFADNI